MSLQFNKTQSRKKMTNLEDCMTTKNKWVTHGDFSSNNNKNKTFV